MGDVHGYPVASYSGGWRTKTQLAAAKPLSADVLMFNETTGHSDVRHEWLEDWRRLPTFPGQDVHAHCRLSGPQANT